LLPSGGFFFRGLLTLTVHGTFSDSAGNYQLINVESTVKIGFPPGITRKNMIPPGVTNSWKLIQTGKIKMCEKILKVVKISKVQILFTAKVNFFYKFKNENVIKMKNKPHPDLSRGSYLFNETKISRDYPFK
jgi:hypothetical protein